MEPVETAAISSDAVSASVGSPDTDSDMYRSLKVDRRPLKGLGYGVLAGAWGGCLAGVGSLLAWVCVVWMVRPPTGPQGFGGGAVVFGVVVAAVVGAAAGTVPGGIGGLFFGASRLERFAPAVVAVVTSAVSVGVMRALYEGDYNAEVTSIASVAVAVCGLTIGYPVGRWFKRLLESPY